MGSLKIAVMVHSLRLGLEKGIEWTAQMGVPGVHIACCPRFCYQDLDLAGRKKFHKYLQDSGVELSAICAWGGGVDLGEPEGLDKNIEEGKRLLEFAADLECGIWQGHCGIMPHSSKDPKWARFVDSFGKICRHGEKVGAKLAIETGPEPPIVLMQMIKEVGSSALNVNYDPANLILWPARYMKDAGQSYNREKAFAEYQPVEGVKALGNRIIHTHAKDAMVFPGDVAKEVALGDGWIDWPKYVSNLRGAGFDGYFAIEREVGENPVADITKAIEYLRTL